MAWPFSDKDSLRIATDWAQILFSYDDLLDDPSTGLMQNESGTTEFSKIIISAIADTENFKAVPSLPIATAFHEYVFTTLFNSLPLPAPPKSPV